MPLFNPGVSSVVEADGSVDATPSTGDVAVSVDVAHDFNWTGLHNFGNNAIELFSAVSSVGGQGNLTMDGLSTSLADDNGLVLDGGVFTEKVLGVTTYEQSGSLGTFFTPLDFSSEQALNFRIENRTSDPGSPAVGQVWLRTDL